MIGLPTLKTVDENGQLTEGRTLPIQAFSREIIRLIKKHYYYALNKARGIGATEIILRYILFLAITNQIKDRKYLIVPGIRLELAKDEIKRIKAMITKIPWVLKGKTDTTLWINKSWIIGLPAHPSVIRGYENVGFVFLDESGHWTNIVDDTPVLEAAEPHVNKSSAHIVAVSTPNGRRGFFAKIFHSIFTVYFTHTLNYQVALGSLINEVDVLAKKKEDQFYFEQEYNCQFLTTRYSAIPEEALQKLRASGEGYALD
jgi:hypothetical protein